MREVNARTGAELHIGRVGENKALCVVFGVGEWRRTYGDGVVQLLHQRNGDKTPYPCTIEVEGDRACWPVTESDVAHAGTGKAELQYLVGDVVVKSETYATRTERALGQAGPTPPAPHESWVRKVLQAGSAAETSAEEAVAAADIARDSAASVVDVKQEALKAQEIANEALEALEGIDEAQQAVAADRAAIEAMTVTSETLEPGEDATVEKTKKNGVMSLHFGIPTGNSGVYVGTTKPTDPNVRVWINPNGKASDIPGGGGSGEPGKDGEDGGYYTPAVNNGVLTWKASKADMPSVPAANVKGEPGKDGNPGISPHIGANGNWFIGDEDTGVSASGGGSTGGGEADWQKKTVTLTEAVSAIEINDLSAKKAIVYACLVGNDAENSLTTGTGKLRVYVNGRLASYADLFLRASGGFYYFFDVEKLVQRTKFYGTKTWGSGVGWSITTALAVGGWADTDKDTSETINSISIAVEGTTHFISSGGWMEVYYK